MSTHAVRSILRIVAVVTVLVGAIGVSTSIIAGFAMSAAIQSTAEGLSIHRDLSSVGVYAALTWLVVIFWGVVLWNVSAGLARYLVSEPDGAPSTEVRRDPRRV